MKPGNLSSTSEFLLLGLSGDPELQPLLFCLFLSMYLVTVLGNLLIILAITSTTVPKMLVNIQTQSKSISYTVTNLLCPDVC